MTETTRNILVLFQLFIGLAWVLGLVWMFLSLAGIAEPISVLAVVTYWGGLLLGPILLIGGSIFLLGAIRRRTRASIIAIVGSLVVAVQSVAWVGPSLGESLRRQERVFPVLWAAIVGASVLTVLVAYLLHRDARSQVVPSRAR